MIRDAKQNAELFAKLNGRLPQDALIRELTFFVKDLQQNALEYAAEIVHHWTCYTNIKATPGFENINIVEQLQEAAKEVKGV